MKIGSIVMHCYEFDRMVSFWQKALGYVPREPASDGWVVLRDPQGRAQACPFRRESGARADEAGCISISTRAIRKWTSSGCWRWEHAAIRGSIDLAPTLWYWR